MDEGTLTFHENGTWTFDPGVNLDHNDKQSIQFELIKVDGDGDRASDTHRIKIKDGADPTPGDENGEGGTVALEVNERGLRESADSDKLVAQGDLTFTAGSDDIVDFAFGDTGGIHVDGLDGTLTWSLDADGNLIGNLDGAEVLKLSLAGTDPIAAQTSGTVTVSVELLGALPHDVDSLTIEGIEVVAIDRDGDVSAPGRVGVDVLDDLPTPKVDEVDLSKLDLTTFDRFAAEEGGTSDSANVGAAFLAAVTPNYGADGKGSIEISDYALAIDPTVATGLQSQGVDIVLEMDGDDVVGMAGETEVFRLSVDESGEVTLTQSAVIDHSWADGKNVEFLPEGSVTLNAVATVIDGDGDAVTIDVSAELGGSDGVVNFVDAIPEAHDSSIALEELEIPPFYANVSLALDISFSMYQDGVMGEQKEAALKLLERYEEALGAAGGEVKVQLVMIGTDATASNWGNIGMDGIAWMTIDEAKALIEAIPEYHPPGWSAQYTNYTAALNGIMDNYDGRVDEEGVQNHSYFLTDGDPAKAGSGWGGGLVEDPVPQEVLDLWHAFLESNDMLSYAIGMGDSPTAEHLQSIAYNGLTGEDHDDLLHLDIDFDDLADLLASLAPEPVSNYLDIDFGADDGHILSITVDGVTYLYDPEANDGEGAVTGGGEFNPATNELTVETNAGGTFTLDMQTGAYTYVPPESVSGGVTEEIIEFVVIDGDGDTAGATLTIDLESLPIKIDAEDNQVVGKEDTALVVKWEDFKVSGEAEGIVITDMTEAGTLQLKVGDEWVDIAEGQKITKADIEAGNLRFMPDENESGFDKYEGDGVGNKQADYAHITFKPYTGTQEGQETTLTVDIKPVADAPEVSLTVTPGEVHSEGDGAEIIKVNGGSGVPGGFDVQDGQIIKIGDGVRVWLSEGDSVPELNGGTIAYYGQGNSHGDSGYSDIFVLHPDSGYWQDGNWRAPNAVTGNRGAQSDGTPQDYIFLSGDPAGYSVNEGPNNRNDDFNTIDNISVNHNGKTIVQGSNQIEGWIHGDGTWGGPNPEPEIEKEDGGNGGVAYQEFTLNVSAELTDTDGSEILSGITLTGIPEGASVELVDPPEGVKLKEIGNGWFITNPGQGDLNDIELTLQVPLDAEPFVIKAEATSTEVYRDENGNPIPVDGVDTATGYDQAAGVVAPVEPPVIDGLDDAIVVNEAYLEGGTKEGEGEPEAEGSFTVSSQVGISQLSIAGESISIADLLALAGGNGTIGPIDTAEGNTLVITGYDGDAKGGTVHYELILVDSVTHPGPDEDSLDKEAIPVSVVDELGQSSAANIGVTIVDDTPSRFELAEAIEVPVSEIEMADLDAGWQNMVATSGSGQVTTTSDDSGIYIQWGGSSGSGYDFVYSEGLTGSELVETDSLFSLGTLTHNNFSISANSKVLDTVDLEVSFTVVIDGVPVEVTTVIQLEHDETPNNKTPVTHEDNDDIVKITNPEQEQVITVGDREYVLKIKGFMDEDGKLVDTVYTTETKASSFELYAEIASTDDLPVVTGQVEADWGADGAAAEGSLLWRNGEEAPVSSGTIEGQHGTLTVNADGTYTYEVSRGARDGMKAGESYEDEFTYYLTDADGDVVASTLTINLEGVVNGIVAVGNVATADLALVDIMPEPVHSQVMGNETSHHATSNTRVDNYSETFVIEEGSTGQFSFDVSISTPSLWPQSTSASLSWSLLKSDGNDDWVEVPGYGGNAGNGVHGATGLEEGEYKVEFTATTSGSVWLPFVGTSYSSVSISDVNLIQQPDSYQEAQATAVEGNVLTDSGVDGSSDIPGSTNTVLKVWDGEAFVAATKDGVSIAGQYGEFTLYADGGYLYEPDPDIDSVGQIDTVAYQLAHPSGVTAEASLQVGITGPGVDSFVWGTDSDDSIAGGGGNDIIVGGAGDDILTGGEGNDVFKWNFGDQGTTEAPANDVVTDFANGNNTLDLADLLQGEDGSNIGQFVLAEQEGADTVLYLSSDGSLAGSKDNADQVIRLQGKSFEDFGAEAGNSGDLISKMIESGQLHIDQ
ncbi:BapA/Bap/LapF family large adhesin [Billgrantia endophytica]|uniref:BapA/Bap/LapF family large adhesin n=1 Tax=Billgrantia endophytica TaxID=2033802 RepID=UPI00105593FA|nr:BapA/Bap/LapF family large adhesin [Halomonas endophytica]